MMEMEAASIAMVQDTIDAMNQQQKRLVLKQLRTLRKGSESAPVWAYILMMTLEHRCSVARGVEITLGKMADGSLKATARIGSPTAPRVEVPASMFRHEV